MHCILHTIETSGIGGAETVMLQVAAGLDRRYFRSIAAVPANGALRDALERRGVQTFLAPSTPWWDLRSPVGLARLCRRERVDLVHSHLPDRNFTSCLAGRLARRPVVATYHGALDFWRARSWRGRVKFGVVRRSAAASVGVCNSVADLLLAQRFPRDRVRRIYNGVDAPADSERARAGLREHFGWPETCSVVGTVANVRVTKGYEYFVHAARRVVDDRPDVRFVAAGDIDPAIGGPIRSLVAELGLSDHVKFLGFRHDVRAVLRDLDVFVMASTSEGFPLVLLEAMATRTPIVATRCGGPEEVLRDGANGRLVPVRDPVAIAGAVLELLANASRRNAMVDAGAETARAFSTDEMVSHYADLYGQVLKP